MHVAFAVCYVEILTHMSITRHFRNVKSMAYGIETVISKILI